VIDFIELDMREHMLPATAAMYTIAPDAVLDKGIEAPRIPGSLHAAEHAAIGLLPLVAGCDRGDIRGMSSAIGPDGLPGVFVYDGSPGGAGLASVASARPAPGWAPQPRPSRPANARADARRACSPPSAAAATTRWTRRVLC
jgi:DEAD/DEAH box helicase domain-containing protein